MIAERGDAMDVKEALRSAIQDWVVPEFDKLRLENAEIRATLQLTNKRLDDIQQQLIDQSRRIDETNKRIDKVHDDLLARIDETNKRIDETNDRIDKVNADLIGRIDRVRNDLTERIDRVHGDLIERIGQVHAGLLSNIERNNMRLDRLYEAIVRREEHSALEGRVARLEGLVEDLRQRLVA